MYNSDTATIDNKDTDKKVSRYLRNVTYNILAPGIQLAIILIFRAISCEFNM